MIRGAGRNDSNMKWIYGKPDFRSLARSEENCFLMTNGLGGFTSLTMAGGAARNDHSVFMACTNAPNCRCNMIHRLKEVLYINGQERVLSTQEFDNAPDENGYKYLSAFVFEDTPLWQFDTDGVEIVKEMGMLQEENTAAVQYTVDNRSKNGCTLEITPFLQFTPKGHDLDKDTVFKVHTGSEENCAIGENSESSHQLWQIEANGLEMSWHVSMEQKSGSRGETGAEVKTAPVDVWETCYYSYDDCDGRRPSGTARAVLKSVLYVPAGACAALKIVYSMEKDRTGSVWKNDAAKIIEQTKTDRRVLSETAGFTSPVADTLAKSAWQFVSCRASTKGKTILAGYPFFEDWGRDTMIALPGVCLATGQYDTAKSILYTFAAHEKDGLMPNLFPEGGNKPMYNTVDAALLFINCVYLYTLKTKDMAFVREMFPVMERIIEGYKKGTHFGIHMDKDGLISAGQGLDQVTWMDVRVGEVLPTPRHGKPVEINAYWYNALKIMENLSKDAGKDGAPYGALAQRVKEAFTAAFWREDAGCLKDVISAVPCRADDQIRCNQIWAVSMPFTMLDREKEKRIVETVFEKLYTPCGLRTLAMDDPDFHGEYGGETFKRDMAYHQGTVWVFPLGAYYLAYLKVHDYSREARQKVLGQLGSVESALREGCIGQLPEIYDGAVPTASRGCFAQAWSVGEILRVYEKLEKEKGV